MSKSKSHPLHEWAEGFENLTRIQILRSLHVVRSAAKRCKLPQVKELDRLTKEVLTTPDVRSKQSELAQQLTDILADMRGE